MLRSNMETIPAGLSNRNERSLTANNNGRIVKNTDDDFSQCEQQSGVVEGTDYFREGNSGLLDCENANTKHTVDKNCIKMDNSIETEETKNQGSSGGPPPVNHSHMGDLKNDVVGADLDLILKCLGNMFGRSWICSIITCRRFSFRRVSR